MKKFLEEFKKFALRGNVIDLAVGVIIGGAFTGIVTAVTDNFINPLLNFVLTRNPGAGWSFGGSVSSFLTTLINFFITALVLFLLLRAMNTIASLGKKKEPEAPTTKKCPYCLSEIPIAATRCPHCTSEQPAEEEKKA